MSRDRLPTKEDFSKIIEIASRPETADYVISRMLPIVRKLKEVGEKVLATMKQFQKNIHLEYENYDNPWAGILHGKTTTQRRQYNHAINALKGLDSMPQGIIKFDLAIGDASELVRAFSQDGVALDAETASVLDQLFNAWLAENNMYSQGSSIYELDDSGKEPKKDKHGNPVKANAEKVKQLISDKQKGLAPYLSKEIRQNTKGQEVTVVVQEHAYPKQKVQQASAASTASQTATNKGPEQSSIKVNATTKRVVDDTTPETPTPT